MKNRIIANYLNVCPAGMEATDTVNIFLNRYHQDTTFASLPGYYFQTPYDELEGPFGSYLECLECYENFCRYL